MKVLMFGWEFPPHISGGLGTACFGLTQALMKAKVDVLFVVPRLPEGPDVDGFLIDASKIVPDRKARPARGTSLHATDRIKAPLPNARHTGTGYLSYLEVPAALSPYTSSKSRQTAHRDQLSYWSYALTTARERTYDSPRSALMNDEMTPDSGNDDDFPFRGAYGENLMEEVKRYGIVGGVIAKQHTFDIIHAHDWMTFPAGIIAKRKTGKPLVVHVHSTEYDRAGEQVNSDVCEIEKMGFNQADHIVSVSNWTKEILVTRYHIHPGKIKVVHNGIRPKDKILATPFPELGSHFITFLGRVTHQKGPGYFVDAARKVLREFPKAHFIVAGAGDLLPQIIEQVAHYNMSANFHFTGFLSDPQVDQIWSMTDVYVMPSVSEPFGIAPLEAIQGNVPVIVSRQSGVAEVMPHAIKVDFWDTEALAAAICSVMRYESLSRVLRQNSKNQLKHLTWDNAAADVKALYHELSSTT